MENNIRLYVTNFNLIQTAVNSYSDTSGKCVFRIKDEYVELKTAHNRWKRHKHSDLVESVIHNVPLHG
jgi:hypothetical protein